MLVCGALVALIPGLPPIQLLMLAQVLKGVLLPIELIFILRLINDRRIMGTYVTSPLQNVIAWGTTGLIIALCTVMLASILLPLLGIPFLQ
jgi:Mn2+/Fe2+ NRAMP family transporter